mmetsp:Transcript_1831/g.4903  ORF Transcript_1831/g.4903 Transcript_1831/m.4903 type:complete len:230 (-) Transcript_1831:331-1020(-)
MMNGLDCFHAPMSAFGSLPSFAACCFLITSIPKSAVATMDPWSYNEYGRVELWNCTPAPSALTRLDGSDARPEARGFAATAAAWFLFLCCTSASRRSVRLLASLLFFFCSSSFSSVVDGTLGVIFSSKVSNVELTSFFFFFALVSSSPSSTTRASLSSFFFSPPAEDGDAATRTPSLIERRCCFPNNNTGLLRRGRRRITANGVQPGMHAAEEPSRSSDSSVLLPPPFS